MNPVARWRRRDPAPPRDSYMTPAQHQMEAERLTYVIDERNPAWTPSAPSLT